jgi:hypothetical protein
MGKTMAKKSSKKANKPLAADVSANQPAAVRPLDKAALSGHRTGLSEAAATPIQAAKPFAEPTAAVTSPAKLAPVATTRPTVIQPEATKSTEIAPVAAKKTPAPATFRTVKVTFVLLDLSGNLAGRRVSVCGDFNGWAPDATPMNRNGNGHFETTVALAPGRYEYKFVVDGEWLPDPLAHENVWNQHGTLNSVIEVRA